MERAPAPRTDSRLPLGPVTILSVPIGPPTFVHFLGQLHGLMTHWTRKGSVPCDGDGKCAPSLHRTAKIFKAYSAVLEWMPGHNRWRPRVLEATSNLEEYLRNRKLRGEIWSLQREDEKNRQSPVEGAFIELREDPNLPLEFALEDVLCRAYNVTRLLLDVTNPMPARIFLEEIPGAPPVIPADLAPQPQHVEDPEQRRRVRESFSRHTREMERYARQEPSPAGRDDRDGHNGNGNGHNGHAH